MEYLVPAPPAVAVVWVTEDSAPRRLIIRLIIQTIRLDPSGSVWTDEGPNLSSLDPSGADQIDAEHQSTDLAVEGSNLSRRAQPQRVGEVMSVRAPRGRQGGSRWRPLHRASCPVP